MEIMRYLKSFNESKVKQDIIDDCKDILLEVSDKENVEVFKCQHDGDQIELFVVIGPKIFLNKRYILSKNKSDSHDRPYFFGENGEDLDYVQLTEFDYVGDVKSGLLHLLRYLMQNKFRKVKFRNDCDVTAEWDLDFFYKKMSERTGNLLLLELSFY